MGEGTSLAMLPFFMAGAAGPLGAYWADAVLEARLGGTDPSAVSAGPVRTDVRKRFACGGMGAAAAFAWVAYAFPGTSPTAAVLMIGLSSACSFAGSAGGYEAAKLEVAAPEAAGLLQGISQTIGNAAAIPAVPLAATIANVAGWDTVFMFLAGCYACAAAIFWRWGTAERLFGPAG